VRSVVVGPAPSSDTGTPYAVEVSTASAPDMGSTPLDRPRFTRFGRAVNDGRSASAETSHSYLLELDHRTEGAVALIVVSGREGH